MGECLVEGGAVVCQRLFVGVFNLNLDFWGVLFIAVIEFIDDLLTAEGLLREANPDENRRVVDVTREEQKHHIARAKQLSLSLLYWLQTEAPRDDGGQGWSGLRLRNDIMGTSDGLAKYPYVRESRRIKALKTILEQHCGVKNRMQIKGLNDAKGLRAKSYPDSVGIGHYQIDLHPSSGGENYIDFATLPFEIPLGALIPRRLKNLIPASKNIGTTHLTNGCYRLHPVEWNIGEVAGILVSESIAKSTDPEHFYTNKKRLNEFQDTLIKRGIEIRWPKTF